MSGKTNSSPNPSDVSSQPPRGTVPVHFVSLHHNASQDVDGEVVEEELVCINVNTQELATMMCSPTDLDKLALGFLYNEQLIQRTEDVQHLHVSEANCVEIWLTDPDFRPPERRIITAGCGGGVTFDDLSRNYPPLTADIRATPTQLANLMRKLHQGAVIYQRARGIHTAALAEGDELLIQMEDVGRHNCIDKLAGAALQQKLPTSGKILLSSGRISSEMLNKARRLEIPLICSRTSPTSLSVALAQAWNITIVAYLRQDRMRVYTHPARILT